MHPYKIVPYEGAEPYIFISYAHKDSPVIMPILEQLYAMGYRIWFDDGITPGSEWPENIARHLNDSSVVLAFISPNSVESDHCRREVTFALSKRKHFVGIYLRETQLSLGLELQLSAQLCLFYHEYASDEAFLKKLLACEELAPCLEQRGKPEITKIVITGGPCAGKTTAMSWLQSNFHKLGYGVLFIPETAAELMTGGLSPQACRTNLDFQKCLMQLQLDKEKAFCAGAEALPVQKVLIVCDRGALDNKAYMSEKDFKTVLEELGCRETELRDSYDAVFHLETSAKGSGQFYTGEGVASRAEAVEQDNKLIAAWTGHPHFRVIHNQEDLGEKLKQLMREITAFLGEQEPYEIERKFLIAYPDTVMLERLPNCERVEIIQTYLTAPEGEEARVRQRGAHGSYVYTHTTKRFVTPLKRVEIERRLSQEEYLRLMMEADPDYRSIRKTRYCLTHENKYYEIDIFPNWKDKAMLEIELSSEEEDAPIPDFFTVLEEVTHDEAYKNRSLAKL